MAQIRVKRSEVAAGRGELRVGALVIDPATSVVCGRCMSLTTTPCPVSGGLEYWCDIWVEDSRVGEVMTHLRAGQLREERRITDPNIRPSRACAQASTEVMQDVGTVWHVSYVHTGVGYVGTATNVHAAFQHLVDQCPEAAVVDVVMLDDSRRMRVKFPIHVKSTATANNNYNATEDHISYSACVAGSWGGQVGTGSSIRLAVTDLKQKCLGWDLGDAIGVDQLASHNIPTTAIATIHHVSDNNYLACWSDNLYPHIGGFGSTAVAAAADLVSKSIAANKFVPTQTHHMVVNRQGEAFTVEMRERADGLWVVSVQGWSEDPIAIAASNRNDAMDALTRGYPYHAFNSRLVTIPLPNESLNATWNDEFATGPTGPVQQSRRPVQPRFTRGDALDFSLIGSPSGSLPRDTRPFQITQEEMQSAFLAGLATRQHGVTLEEAMVAMAVVPPPGAVKQIPVAPPSSGPSRSRRVIDI